MNKQDFKDISIIVPIRIDTKERGENLNIIWNFYKENCENVDFIFVENDCKIKSNLYIPINNIHYFIENTNVFNKCKTFNTGGKLSKRKYVCFLDVDIIINPQQIINAKNKIIENKMDLMIPYNGIAFYLTKESKDKFMIYKNYDYLVSIFPEKFHTNYQNKNLLIANNQSVGGCIIMSNDFFYKINGFNPNILIWGYDDNEIISRSQKLDYKVGRINGRHDVLWHLPHEDKNSKPKEQHPFYEQNHQIVSMVESSTKEQLQEYIKTWEI